jgi:hypothetical protein
MPTNMLGSAIFGNAFKFTREGRYEGVSSNSNGAYIITNIGLNYFGNRVGAVHGEFLGDMLSNSSEAVFDMYSNIK